MCFFRRLFGLGAHFPSCVDVAPTACAFQPCRAAEPHLPAVMDNLTPFDLFRLYFNDDILQLIVEHTNTKGRYRKGIKESKF